MTPVHNDPERALIGAILFNPSTIDEISSIVRPEHLRSSFLRDCYEAAQSLLESGTTPDTVTILPILERAGNDRSESISELVELSRSTVTDSNAGRYARLVYERFMRDELRRISSNLSDVDGDPFEAVRDAETRLHELIDVSASGTSTPIRTVVSESITTIRDAVERFESSERKPTVSGVPCGLFCIDDRLDGWQPGHLYVLAARPGAGKTSLALQFAEHAARNDYPVRIQSLEMTRRELVIRLLNARTSIDTNSLRRGDLRPNELDLIEAHGVALSDLPIDIDDRGGLSVRDIWSRARLSVRRHRIRLLIVDYLQIVATPGRSNRSEEVDAIVKTLKEIAKDLDIAVVALSQLNREVERRTKTRRPQLSDLKESGGIEEAADAVTFIYRPYMYDDDPQRTDDNGVPRPVGYTELITAKFRHGAIGTDRVLWNGPKVRFQDYYESETRTPSSFDAAPSTPEPEAF